MNQITSSRSPAAHLFARPCKQLCFECGSATPFLRRNSGELNVSYAVPSKTDPYHFSGHAQAISRFSAIFGLNSNAESRRSARKEGEMETSPAEDKTYGPK